MTFDEMIARVKADPRTTWAAIVLGAVGAGGEYLHQAHFEPWGSMLLGVSGFGAFICMVFSRFSKPPEAPK